MYEKTLFKLVDLFDTMDVKVIHIMKRNDDGDIGSEFNQVIEETVDAVDAMIPEILEDDDEAKSILLNLVESKLDRLIQLYQAFCSQKEKVH